VIVILGMLLSVAANIDFTMSAADTLALLLKPLLYLLALALGTMSAAMFSQNSWLLDDRPGPWFFYCMVTGLGLFLLHNLIDFSWFEPGAMFLFMALLGAALGMAPVENRPPGSRSFAIAGTIAGVACWVAAAILFVAPVLIAEQSAADANELIRTAPIPPTGEITSHFRRAADALATASQLVPYNEDYFFRQAQACLSFGDLDQAKVLIAHAKQINPMLVDPYLLDANVELSQPNPDPAAVRADFNKILQLNPNDVSLRVQYGNALERFGLLPEAREQYRLALNANDALPIGEPKRLPPEDVEKLRAKSL
jgi:tetratricopeptide (TPR) repeat protein